MTDLKDLKELAEAATGSEWEASGTVVWMPDVEYGMEPDCCGCFNRDGSCCGNAVPRQTEELVQREIANADGRDAAFIAAANPKTILELIARVEAAERERDNERAWRNRLLACKYSVQEGALKIERDSLRAALEQAKAREAELRSALERLSGILLKHEQEARSLLDYEEDTGISDMREALIAVVFNDDGQDFLHTVRFAENAVTAMGGDDNG